MTTVVFTKDQVAADGMITDGHRIGTTDFSKICETDRYIIGMAGCVGQCQRVVDWIKDGFVDQDGTPYIPYIHEREEVAYSVAYIDKLDGKIYCVEGLCFDIIECSYPYAIGSGGDFALGYLYGKRASAKGLAAKAIKAASRFDHMTNDTIKIINVNLLDNEEDL